MRLFAPTALALALALGAATVPPSVSHAQVSIGISVGYAPPPLPEYWQPPCPGYGYLWTPGYWAWDDYDEDYYWVPGTWVRPPRVGYLWTPPWWGFRDGGYVFNAGYWGPTVGFYGGIAYGFGYGGHGYDGGYWRNGGFYYNRTVNNISNTHIDTFYDRPVINPRPYRGVSYNGGRGGIDARPTRPELAGGRYERLAATPEQRWHIDAADRQTELRAGFNRGAPAIAATPRAAALRDPGAAAAFGWRQDRYPSRQNAPTYGGERGSGAPFYGRETLAQPRGSPAPTWEAPAARNGPSGFRGGPRPFTPSQGPGAYASAGGDPAPRAPGPGPDRRNDGFERPDRPDRFASPQRFGGPGAGPPPEGQTFARPRPQEAFARPQRATPEARPEFRGAPAPRLEAPPARGEGRPGGDAGRRDPRDWR